jgi:hypothetical protein
MNFIQDYGAVIQTSKERLRILKHPPYPRQLAIEILNVGQALGEISLTHPPNPGQPYNRAPFPSTLYLLQPKSAIYQMQLCYHLVLLNAKPSASRDGELMLCFPVGSDPPATTASACSPGTPTTPPSTPSLNPPESPAALEVWPRNHPEERHSCYWESPSFTEGRMSICVIFWVS